MSDGSGAAPCFVCRCEEIGEAEVRSAIAAGAHTVNDVKRRTKAGMGLCQGIYCVPAIANLLRGEAVGEAATVNPMTVRPPLRLASLESLAALVRENQ